MRKYFLLLLLLSPLSLNAQQLYPFPQDGKWGYVNSAGKVIVEPIYESASFFSDRLARVAKLNSRKEYLYGFINTSGQEVISAKFQSVSDFQGGIARVKVKNGYQVLLQSGRLVTSRVYDDIESATNGMAVVRIGDKYGYVNTDGAMSVPTQFTSAQAFSDNGRAVVSTNEGRTKLYGVINKKGEFIIPPMFMEIKPYVNGFTAVAHRKNYWQVMDTDGNLVSKEVFKDVGSYANGLINVKVNNEWGYINSAGEMIIKPQFIAADNFVNGLAIVGNGKAFAYIDTLGRMLTPYIFTRVTRFDGKLARVSQGKNNGFMNSTGKYNLSDKISSIGSFYNERARMKVGSFYGYYGQTAKLEIPPKYLYASDFRDDLALTIEPMVGGYKIAYLNKSGRVVKSWNVLSKPVPAHNDVLFSMVYPSVPFYKESTPSSLIIIRVPFGDQVVKQYQRTATPLVGQGLQGYLYSVEYYSRPGFIYSEAVTSFPTPNIGMGLKEYFREKFGVLLETASPHTYKPLTAIYFNGTTQTRSIKGKEVTDNYTIPFMKISEALFLVSAALGYPLSEYPTETSTLENFLKKDQTIRFSGRWSNDAPQQFTLTTPNDGQILVTKTDLGVKLLHRYEIPEEFAQEEKDEKLFVVDPKAESIEQISTNEVQIQMLNTNEASSNQIIIQELPAGQTIQTQETVTNL